MGLEDRVIVPDRGHTGRKRLRYIEEALVRGAAETKRDALEVLVWRMRSVISQRGDPV